MVSKLKRFYSCRRDAAPMAFHRCCFRAQWVGQEFASVSMVFGGDGSGENRGIGNCRNLSSRRRQIFFFLSYINKQGFSTTFLTIVIERLNIPNYFSIFFFFFFLANLKISSMTRVITRQSIEFR